MNDIFTLLLTALLGSMMVPILIVVLVKFGFFEPFDLYIFGRTWALKPFSFLEKK